MQLTNQLEKENITQENQIKQRKNRTVLIIQAKETESLNDENNDDGNDNILQEVELIT